MEGDRPLPDDPLAFLKTCLSEGRILWTYHVNMRMRQRGISRRMLWDALPTYQLVESYPGDKYPPSYLVLGYCNGEALHVVFAADLKDRNVRIITVYRPDLQVWKPDFMTRRLT